MNRTCKGTLIGGAVGAGLFCTRRAIATSPAEGEAAPSVTGPALKAIAEGALAGAGVGFLLDRRAAKAAAAASRLPALGTAAALARERAGEWAETARPALDRASEVARERAGEWAETARPALDRAAVVARERASDAYIAARPALEHAAVVTRERAGEWAEHARPAVDRAAVAARERAMVAADVARDRIVERRAS